MSRIRPARKDDGQGSIVLRAMMGLAVSCLIALIYLVALVTTMPAHALHHFVSIPGPVTALYGTVWQGRAELVMGYTIDWSHRTRDLLRLRIAADVALSGADTQLMGTAAMSPWAMAVRDLSGRAGPGLLGLVPGLALDSCTTSAAVNGVSVALMRDRAAAAGLITVDAGTCTEVNGRINPVPPLEIIADTVGPHARARVTTGDTLLAQAVVADDRRFVLTLEPDGSALIPGLPVGAPITLEYPF